MNQTETEHVEKRTEENVAASGAQAGMQTASRQQEKKIQNEQFLNELRKADIDSEVFDWPKTSSRPGSPAPMQ